MKIRTRITLQFSLFVTAILIGFAVSIYYSASNNRKEEFYNRLKNVALTSVKLLSDVDEVDVRLLKIIHDNTVNNLTEELISIYDSKNKLVFTSDPHSRREKLTTLEKIKAAGEVRYEEENTEVIGILFKGKFGNYIVIAKSYDSFGFEKLDYLRYILLTGVLIAVLVIIVVGLFFSRQALHPISNVVNQMDRITISNLNLRINEGNGTDEIAQLAIKFNRMLERLDVAFEMQRSFVSNTSHELRTPLTALTGQLEVALMNEKTSDPWDVLRLLLKEIKQLNKLSNGLLGLAQANLDISEIKLESIRIDELIGLARAELLKRNKSYKVNLNFVGFPEESWLILLGNEQLLKSALMNIMDNACKYSEDSEVLVELNFSKSDISIVFLDKGIGISSPDIDNIFEPFFRSKNAKIFCGHGIGLPLAKKIIELHKGTINVTSELGVGTKVQVSFPPLSNE